MYALRSAFYWWLGLCILLANKIRYAIGGYRTPRPLDVADTKAVLAYDDMVVRAWERQLGDYGGGFEGARVLELGPGADLGAGLLVLERGSTSYTALDVNNLIVQADRSLYESFLARMERDKAAYLREQLDRCLSGQDGAMRYVLNPSFDFSPLPAGAFDLIVSNGAFEHFVDIPGVIEQMTRVAAPGAVLCSHIDLATHTGAVRKRDPLNIYRFSQALYRRLRFSGIPNRVRPSEYVAALRRSGWQDIRAIPNVQIADADLPRLASGLAREYREEGASLRILMFFLVARLPGGTPRNEAQR